MSWSLRMKSTARSGCSAIISSRCCTSASEKIFRTWSAAISAGDGSSRTNSHADCDAPEHGPTLVIDPTLPDLTPRLPAWQYPVQDGVVGWTEAGWPVVKRGSAWAIEPRWHATDRREERARLHRHFSDAQALHVCDRRAADYKSVGQSCDRSNNVSDDGTSAQPTTNVATTQPLGPPIGFDSEGAKYYDGRYASSRRRDGSEVVWPLPAPAVGSWEHPRLIEAEGRLFLFNESGRALRLKRDPKDDSFALEATFVRNIPNVEQPRRIWLDPAGRIVIAYEGNALTILFPSGQIPRSIAQRMLAADLKANEPE